MRGGGYLIPPRGQVGIGRAAIASMIVCRGPMGTCCTSRPSSWSVKWGVMPSQRRTGMESAIALARAMTGCAAM